MGEVVCHAASVPMTVPRAGDVFTVCAPIDPPASFEDRGAVAAAVGSVPREVLKPAKQGGKLLALLASEAEVRGAEPDMERVKALPGDGLIITARGETVDFVSRYFAPHAGIPEDPVTGSAHVVLTPFRSEEHTSELQSLMRISYAVLR